MATATFQNAVLAKASGTTVTLSDLSLTESHSIFAIVGFKGTIPPSSVKAGTKDMHKVVQRIDTPNSFGTAIYYKRRIRNGNTRDIVATWAAATTGKVMIVCTVDEAMLFFEGTGNVDGDTVDPTTTQNASDLPVHNCFHLGAFNSEGSVNDTAPSLPADWTLGKRDGTAGAPPISNTTILAGYKFGRCIDAEEMDGTGATTRDWCNVIASFSPIEKFPATDSNGDPLEIGDTVTFNSTEYDITAIVREEGMPVALVELDSTERTKSYYVDLVE